MKYRLVRDNTADFAEPWLRIELWRPGGEYWQLEKSGLATQMEKAFELLKTKGFIEEFTVLEEFDTEKAAEGVPSTGLHCEKHTQFEYDCIDCDDERTKDQLALPPEDDIPF